MSTKIQLNDALFKKAFQYAPKSIKTKQELIELALYEFIENHQRKDIPEIFGKIHFDEGYNYKSMRNTKG